ncbi:unnamed protein product [Sphagnum tenellum]
MGGGGSVRGGRGESSSATKVEPEKINFADVCAISAATTTSSSLSSRPALCNHGHDHHAQHNPFSLPCPRPHRHQRNGSTALVCQLRRPSPFLLDCQEASESVSQRASATECPFSPSLPRLSGSVVRELRPADTEHVRKYFGWVRAHDPCAVVTRTLPVDQSTHYGSKLRPNYNQRQGGGGRVD